MRLPRVPLFFRSLLRATARTSTTPPPLGIHGTRDEIVPYSQGEEVARLLPNATFVPLQGAGHNDTFNGAHFSLVLAKIAAFLDE